MNELMNHFNVSMNTIRNDIRQLVNQNIVKKVYGGVEAVHQQSITAFDLRSDTYMAQKVNIARRAARYIEHDDVIFIDSGTTTMNIIDYCADDIEFTVITHNVSVINACIPKENITVIALPGTLDRKTRSLMDVSTPSLLRRYNIDKSFLAATTISEIGRLNNTSAIESEIKSTALSIANETLLLVDSSKFDKSSLMTFGSLSNIDVLITDKEIDDKTYAMCESLVRKVVVTV